MTSTTTASNAASAVPARRRARDWHGHAQRSVANPRRTRGVTRTDEVTRPEGRREGQDSSSAAAG
jgi:hypothetical protein